MQQGNAAAAAALYEHQTGGAAGGSDAGGDVVMARWLQSAGLQHLASADQRMLPNLLMQVGILGSGFDLNLGSVWFCWICIDKSLMILLFSRNE